MHGVQDAVHALALELAGVAHVYCGHVKTAHVNALDPTAGLDQVTKLDKDGNSPFLCRVHEIDKLDPIDVGALCARIADRGCEEIVLDLNPALDEITGTYDDEDGIRDDLELWTDEIFGADVVGKPMWARSHMLNWS